jgi:hypothetical protein
MHGVQVTATPRARHRRRKKTLRPPGWKAKPKPKPKPKAKPKDEDEVEDDGDEEEAADQEDDDEGDAEERAAERKVRARRTRHKRSNPFAHSPEHLRTAPPHHMHAPPGQLQPRRLSLPATTLPRLPLRPCKPLISIACAAGRARRRRHRGRGRLRGAHAAPLHGGQDGRGGGGARVPLEGALRGARTVHDAAAPRGSTSRRLLARALRALRTGVFWAAGLFWAVLG